MNLFKSPRSITGKENNSVESEFYYKEISEMTSTGSYSIDFQKKTSFIDDEAKNILNTPKNFKFSLNKALEYYADEHKKDAEALFISCAEGKPFKTQIKMLTYDKKEFWAKAIGKPIYNEDNEIIGVRGVFQDINEEKLREIQLDQSLKKIVAQNFKFYNFAHIVSHKLRNQVANLDMMLSLINESDSDEDRNEVIQALSTVSKNLSLTTSNLTDAVLINYDLKNSLEVISFEEVLVKVQKKLAEEIERSNANIHSDFSEFPEIEYFPVYLESILTNLISNSIKYREEDKIPNIMIFSFNRGGKNHLSIKDNGIGIDMEKYSSKIFNMHQFLDKTEATGTGLFITKSQVEEMDGTIEIESALGKGTTVTVTF